MLKKEHVEPLAGQILADDAYWGGELHDDKRGPGSSNKTPFVVAVQLSNESWPQRAKFHRLDGFTKANTNNSGQKKTLLLQAKSPLMV